MSDKIGVLGQSSSTTVSTATAYTCPSGKAAKIRIQSRFRGGANSQVAFLVNGMEIARNAAMSANDYNWTRKGSGLLGANGATAPDGTDASKTVAPADQIYYLSAGQTIQYTVITTALVSMDCQVVGTEIDV